MGRVVEHQSLLFIFLFNLSFIVCTVIQSRYSLLKCVQVFIISEDVFVQCLCCMQYFLLMGPEVSELELHWFLTLSFKNTALFGAVPLLPPTWHIINYEGSYFISCLYYKHVTVVGGTLHST
jgi:hypothetical protein